MTRSWSSEVSRGQAHGGRSQLGTCPLRLHRRGQGRGKGQVWSQPWVWLCPPPGHAETFAWPRVWAPPPPDLSPSLRAACDAVWPPTPVSVAVFLLQRYLGFALGSGLQGNPEVRLGRGARVLNARRHCELRTGERLCLPLAGPGLPFLFPRLMDDSSTPPCVTPFLAISGENPWHARWPRLLTGGLGTKRNKGRAAQCMEGTVQAQRGQGAESQRAPGPTLALEAEHAWPQCRPRPPTNGNGGRALKH